MGKIAKSIFPQNRQRKNSSLIIGAFRKSGHQAAATAFSTALASITTSTSGSQENSLANTLVKVTTVTYHGKLPL
jgi:hypothetical protein